MAPLSWSGGRAGGAPDPREVEGGGLAVPLPGAGGGAGIALSKVLYSGGARGLLKIKINIMYDLN